MPIESLTTVDINSNLFVYYPITENLKHENQDQLASDDSHICIKVSLDAIYGNTPEESDFNLIRAICQPLADKLLKALKSERPVEHWSAENSRDANGCWFVWSAVNSKVNGVVSPRRDYKWSLLLFLRMIRCCHVVFRGSFIKDKFTHKLAEKIKIIPEGEPLPLPILEPISLPSVEPRALKDEPDLLFSVTIRTIRRSRQSGFQGFISEACQYDRSPYDDSRDTYETDRRVVGVILELIDKELDVANENDDLKRLLRLVDELPCSRRALNEIDNEFANQFQNLCSKFIDWGYSIHVKVRSDSALKNMALFTQPGATLKIHASEWQQRQTLMMEHIPSPQLTPLQVNSMFSRTASEVITEQPSIQEALPHPFSRE